MTELDLSQMFVIRKSDGSQFRLIGFIDGKHVIAYVQKYPDDRGMSQLSPAELKKYFDPDGETTEAFMDDPESVEII